MSIEVGGPVEGPLYKIIEPSREERIRRFRDNLNAKGGGCPNLVGTVVVITPPEQAPVSTQIQSIEQDNKPRRS